MLPSLEENYFIPCLVSRIVTGLGWILAVMGNASGREDGAGPSGVKSSENLEDYEQQSMEFGGQGQAHVAMPPLPRPSEVMQVRDHAATGHKTTHYEDEVPEKQTPVMITWSYGGKQVAVTGSWDDWETVEPLWSLGKDFTIMKMLPSGVYHYRFIVDERLRYAPDLPWECDDTGNAYNILDLQISAWAGYEYIPEARECLSEFESPPSPFSSYDNKPLSGSDFSKAPPDLPPQLQMTLLNEPSSATVSHQSLPRPRHTVLNHLYIQNSDGCLPVAISSTCRFRQKYVTVVLYKPSRR
ncbi:hypothetical protein JRO89_XS01G0117400 [Xanthoceras sorbifolium]|uniref:Association with the SNF1 complex (ASC) domain-containing protein n=1 Tax=Xanthoceras sorbifolium TaxID=99658 RepID=A0ABQ8IJ47_9ROSI|nr:hypothetical protein JRO89_XS01G0117400 [Xanthoceras sorbifolium]